MHILARTMLVTAMLLPGLAHADGVAPLPGDGKLAYIQGSERSCTLGLWDSKDGKARTLAQLAECPANLAVTNHDQTLVLVDKADIRLLDLVQGTLGAPMPLPGDVPEKGRSYDAWLAGYTPEGVLALEVVLDEPSGDRRLYLLKAGLWVLTEQRQCGYYEDSCPFKQKVETRPLSGLFGQAPGQIWKDTLLGDPYVVERIPRDLAYAPFDEGEPSDADEGPPKTTEKSDPLKNALVFHVYGRYTKLRFGVQPGEDTDGTYPTGLQLVTPDDIASDLADNQFDAVIVGHYLMFYGMNNDGDKLYDLGNGKVVLDKLVMAGWLQ